jgi:hypothetical protein
MNKEIGWEGVDWIHLDQDGNLWRAFVDTVMNIRGHTKGGDLLDSMRDY